MGIKRIKTRSQRITISGYLKKIQNQRTVADFGYFKKTSQNCRVSWKPRKEEPSRFLGGYFTFTIWDPSFRTSTNGQIGSGFQNLDKQTDEIWVSRPRQTDAQIWVSRPWQMDRRDLGFRTSTDKRIDNAINIYDLGYQVCIQVLERVSFWYPPDLVFTKINYQKIKNLAFEFFLKLIHQVRVSIFK
jgi:hypothetical protein